MSTTGNYSGTHANADAASADYAARAQKEMGKIALDGGKIFGIIPVPDSLKGLAKGMQTVITRWATNDVEGRVGALVSAKYGPKYGAIAGTTARFGIPILLGSIPLIKCLVHWNKDIQAFNEELQPYFAANHAADSGMKSVFGSEEPNAIVAYARNQRHSVHKNSAVSEGIGAGIEAAYVIAALHPKVRGMLEKLGNNKNFQEVASQGGAALPADKILDLGAGFLSESARNHINQKLPAKLKGKCGLDLSKEFIKSIPALSKDLDPLDEYEVKKACKAASRSAMAIFERRFQESGWPDMSERVREDLETLSQAMVRPIVIGEMSPWAIIDMTGEDKIVMNEGSLIANEQELKAALGELMTKFSTDKMESLKDYYGKVSFRKQDVAHALQTLGNEEKAFLAAVLTDKVLLDGGATKEQIATFRTEGQKLFEERAGEILMMLAEQPVKELHEHFSKQEIDIIQKLGTNLSRLDRVSEGKDEAAVKALEERSELLNNRGVRRILANAYVKDASSWEKRITEKRENAKEARAAGIEDEGISGP